jgi:three-Cys-motif partner protein
MSDEHHEWLIGSIPPLIRPHSLAKHRVLDQYLRRYVEVLTSNPKVPDFRLTLVDGFSGGGLYLDSVTGEERPGSPLLMLRAMQQAAAAAQERRSKEFHLDVEYFFIEKSQPAFDHLKLMLEKSEFRSLIGNRITQIRGAFVDHVDAIIRRVKERKRGERAIFVLDQCGYTDVPLSAIRSILHSLDNAEVILTFAVDSLIDYMAANDLTQKILEKIGISLRSEQILTMKALRDSRWIIQTRLIEEIKRGASPQHFTPFFIRSKDAHRDYWLLHLSGHSRARDVMVGLHWKENTSFIHYGRSGMSMLGYDPDEDPRITRQKCLPEFCFDQSARASTEAALFDELPAKISALKDGTSFQRFFADVTNETPATSDIMGDVLIDLARQGVIEIRDADGRARRGRVVRKTDVILPSRQGRLFLP